MNDLPCFTRTDKRTGKKLNCLIDSGATNNYISKDNIKHGKIHKLKTSIFVKTIHGQSEISSYVKISLFTHNLTFYLLENLI